jgi:hypothetical protein
MPRPPMPCTPGPMGISKMQGIRASGYQQPCPEDHGPSRTQATPARTSSRASRPTAQSRPGAVGLQVNQRPGEHHQPACAVEPGRMAPPPDPGQVEGPACLFLPVFPAGAMIRASGRRV